MKNIDLTCLGILVMDIFGKTINAFPEEGTSEYFDSMELLPGGCAYNTGVDAQRLGLNVSIQGKIGNDQFADVLLNALKKENVSVDKIAKGNENTAFSFVMIPDSGQRRILHTPGVNNTYCLKDIDLDSVKNSKIMHIAGSSLMPKLDGKNTVELLKFCQTNGVLTSMDPVYKTDIADVIVPCLPYLDIFLPNNDESVHITGLTNPEEQLQFYLDKGVKTAGVKLGPDGVLISNGTEKIKLGIYDVPVKDTCGAGDAFIAGFLYGTIKEWSLRKIAKFATAIATHCVQAVGATPGVKPANEISEFMNNNEITNTDELE